jgi:hypothetical protein
LRRSNVKTPLEREYGHIFLRTQHKVISSCKSLLAKRHNNGGGNTGDRTDSFLQEFSSHLNSGMLHHITKAPSLKMQQITSVQEPSKKSHHFLQMAL